MYYANRSRKSVRLHHVQQHMDATNRRRHHRRTAFPGPANRRRIRPHPHRPRRKLRRRNLLLAHGRQHHRYAQSQYAEYCLPNPSNFPILIITSFRSAHERNLRLCTPHRLPKQPPSGSPRQPPFNIHTQRTLRRSYWRAATY
jgi:hypothetical protein